MDMDQAAVFLAGSILTGIGFVVIVAAIVAVNNIIYKYWKPLNWMPEVFREPPSRFIEPTIDINDKK
jgi:hypothetical protein